MDKDINIDLSGIWERLRQSLKERGVDVDLPEGVDFCCSDGQAARVKVVCVAPDLHQSVDEMGQTQRDHVVMVRVDGGTLGDLDAWVATGAVKSRSEAAALFIREGLKVRADELEKLRDALREVEDARERLRSRASEVLGRSE